MHQQAGFKSQNFWDFPKGQEWRGNEKKYNLLTNKLVLHTLEKPKGPGLEQDAKNVSNMQENMPDTLRCVKHLEKCQVPKKACQTARKTSQMH